MIDRREHPLSTADLAAGTTARPTDTSAPMDTEMQRGAQDRASEREPRDAGTTVAARPMTEPPMATPGATEPAGHLAGPGVAQADQHAEGDRQRSLVDRRQSEPQRQDHQSDNHGHDRGRDHYLP
jgi:hypothetical protein